MRIFYGSKLATGAFGQHQGGKCDQQCCDHRPGDAVHGVGKINFSFAKLADQGRLQGQDGHKRRRKRKTPGGGQDRFVFFPALDQVFDNQNDFDSPGYLPLLCFHK